MLSLSTSFAIERFFLGGGGGVDGTSLLGFPLFYIIIQQIVTMPIYGKEALNICHPT